MQSFQQDTKPMQQRQAELGKNVQQPTKTRKKVIFYNTTIGGLLSGDMAYLEKLRAVLTFFCEQDDVVLLWRPHPLNAATYQSMRPQLLRAYEQIIDEYINAGWGIYDDTPDLHRAIAISDAYYGDESSVVPLFIAAGKLVMIQNIHEGHSLEPYILPTCLYIDNEFIWFTLYGKSGLFRMDKKTGRSSFVNYFPDISDNGEYLFYNSVAKIADTIHFTPGGANSIVSYSLNGQSVVSDPIEQPLVPTELTYTKGSKFQNAFAYGDKVFFVGLSYPAIICLDTLTGKTEYYTDWAFEIAQQFRSIPCETILADSCVNGSVIAAVSCYANAVLLFDMATCNLSIHKVGNKATGWTSICFDGTDYWLVPRNDVPIVCWNPENNEITEYGKFPANLISVDYRFIRIIAASDHIWLFPLKSNMVLIISKHDGTMTALRQFGSAAGVRDGYVLAHLFGEKIYAIPRSGNIIEEYDTRTMAFQIRPLNIKGSLSETIMNRTATDLLSLRLYREGGLFTLETFFSLIYEKDAITDRTSEGNALSINNGSAGQSIYNFVKRAAVPETLY